MARPRWQLVALVVLLLGACKGPEEGPRGRAAERRAAPGLRIVQPRPEQRFEIWDDLRQLGRVHVLFDLARTSPATPAPTIRFTVGEGAVTEVRDPGRSLVRKPTRGTHLLRAWLLGADGRVRHEDGTHAAVRIHIGADPLTNTVPPLSPTLTWAAPEASARRVGDTVAVDVLVDGAALEASHLRLRVTARHDQVVRTAWRSTPGPVVLEGIVPGTWHFRASLWKQAGEEGEGERELAETAVTRAVEIQ